MEPCDSEEEFINAYDEELMNQPNVVNLISVSTYVLRRLGYGLNTDEESHILDRRYGPQIVQKIITKFLRDGEHDDFYAHKVVYFSAVLSRIWWITDTGLVSTILREAYAYNSFKTMFIPFFNSRIHSEMGKIPDSTTKKGSSTMNFFLHHANKARLQFNGVRFQDLRFLSFWSRHQPPVFYAAEKERPRLLLLLLRFGCKVEVTANTPDDWNLPKILRHLMQILWDSLGGDLQNLNASDLDHTTVMSKHPAAECVNILLRVTPQIRMGEINFPLMKLEGGILTDVSVCSHDFIRLLSEKDIIPEFVNRYLEPSRLTHLCRCVIRDCLNNSWNLPYGVNLLPLSRTVKSYLSLGHD